MRFRVCTEPALLLTLLVVPLLMNLPVPWLPQPHAAFATASFNLYGRILSPAGWGSTATSVGNPGPTLSVSAGDSVTVNLFSADGIGHRFCVDYEATPDFSCNTAAELQTQSATFSSQTVATTVTFTAPSTPGTFTYFCTIHRTAMRGSFVVTAASPPTPDFTMSANPASISAAQGSSGTSSVAITSQNGFAGSVSVSANNPPQGLDLNLNPATVSVTSGASSTTLLTVNASSTIAAGSYQVTISGTNGTLTRTTSLTLVITSSSPGSTPSSNSNLLIGGIAVLAIAILAGAAAFILKRRPHTRARRGENVWS